MLPRSMIAGSLSRSDLPLSNRMRQGRKATEIGTKSFIGQWNSRGRRASRFSEMEIAEISDTGQNKDFSIFAQRLNILGRRNLY